MAILSENIRTAITELLEGTIGTTRLMDSGVLSEGVWDGQLDSQKQAEILDTATATYKFDVELGPLSPHPATPLSVLGNKRLNILEVTITVWGKLATEPERAQRKKDLAAFESVLDDAVMVLSYPDNLDLTNSSLPTNIISGCLVGPGGQGHPDYDEPEEDWELKLIRSEIHASAHLLVDQNPIFDLGSATYTNSSGSRSIWHSSTYTGPFAANEVAKKTISGRTYVQIQGSCVNKVLYSEALDNVAWPTTGDCTVVANQTAAPDGNTTAEEVQFGSGTADRADQFLSGLDDNTTYTGSAFSKLSASDAAWRIVLRDKTNGFEEQTVTATTAWQRSDASIDTQSGATIPQVRAQNDASGGDGDIYVWGYQLEASAYPTSYIPTTSVAVTRAADSLSNTATGTIRGGKWKVRVIPYFADTDMAASETHQIAFIASGEELVLAKTAGGVVQVQLQTTGGNLAVTTITFARYTSMTITVDFPRSSLTLAGADTGDGVATGTVTGWAAGTLYLASTSTPDEHFYGLVSLPEAAA